jgi:DNA-binding LacI/PurR family transcriptional regulator
MFNNFAQSMRHPVRAIAFASIAFGLSLTAGSASAADAKTVAYIAPSLDISYWQWVGYGVKERAQELGMNYIELTSENSPAKQMDNVRTALTRGVSAIVMGPVSSASTPQILRLLKEKHIRCNGEQLRDRQSAGRLCLQAGEGARKQQDRHAVPAAGPRELAEVSGRCEGIV